MKKYLFFVSLFVFSFAKAQKIDSIYVNLYTDSLKKGTYNYINVDGLLSNGKYIPLDSTQISFTSTYGKFFGNSLWIDSDFTKEKVHVIVLMKNNPLLCKDFDIYIKKNEDDPNLKTEEEIMNEMKTEQKKKN